MSIAASFFNLFDKTTHFFQTTYDAFDVNEHAQDAKMSTLHIVCNDTECHSFNNYIVKGIKDITETRSTLLKDSDCDGVTFISKNGHNGLIFAELKSRFSTTHITKAFSQMTFSFLKMHAMLSMCQGYSIDTISLHFIAACKCFENQDQEDGVNNYLEKAKNSNPDTFESKFLRDLLTKHTIIIKLEELAELWHLPLSQSLTAKELKLSLQLTQNYNDTTSEYIDM